MMVKLINDLKLCKEYKKDYRIKPYFNFHIDRRSYLFSFFPTVIWQPWCYRDRYVGGIIEIWWLHFHILIGKWSKIDGR